MRPYLPAAVLFLLAPGLAAAHPHIFAEARLEVVAGDNGQISELHNVWRFDEVFSSSVLLDFDKNTNNILDPDELKEVGSVVLDSMEDFDYFMNITQDGRNVGVEKPKEIVADYTDGQLLLLFAIKPNQPMPLNGSLSFGVYDPTMYTAIDFTTDDDMVLIGSKFDSCNHTVVRPDPDEIISRNQSALTDAFFNDPSGNDMSKLFATRIEISCGQ